MALRELRLWIDPVTRRGPENMAVDEWLLETAGVATLRVYRWAGAWGSIGYFGDLDAARRALPDLDWVRRPTGGGTVDHRNDWTYTLVVPPGESLARAGGSESYRVIHEALGRALRGEGREVTLVAGGAAAGTGLCFRNPVAFDLVDGAGAKVAGAGQRRTRRGLLHQGSVAIPCRGALSDQRAAALAAALAAGWERVTLAPPAATQSKQLARLPSTRRGALRCAPEHGGQ